MPTSTEAFWAVASQPSWSSHNRKTMIAKRCLSPVQVQPIHSFMNRQVLALWQTVGRILVKLTAMGRDRHKDTCIDRSEF